MDTRLRSQPALAAGVLCLALAGCSAASDLAKSLGELQKVQAAVAREAGTPAVQINLMNGKYLTVAIVNSPLGKLPREDKQAKALALARAAFEALPERQALAKVRVTFAVHERRFLVVNYTDARDSFTFDPGELAPAGAHPKTADPSSK